MSYIHRELEHDFLEASQNFKAVLVTGARQVGKSTMLKTLAEGQGRTIVSLDRKADRELAKSEPALFFQTYRPPILIDEVQKAPELFETIKILCDESSERGLFWLTGSQSKRLMKEAEDSLAGRVAIMKMYSLSQREKLGLIQMDPLDFSFEALRARQSRFPKNNILDVYEHIWRGGMPDVQNLNEKMLSTYFESYIDTYLMRDAVDDNGIRNPSAFYKFLRACAAFAGNLLNYADLAAAADVDQSTAKEWVQILQNMGILYLLEPYSNNALKRMVKTPKLYFCDTGLCAYLSMWPSRDILMNGAASGHYFENYVVMELVRNYACHPRRAALTFYRDYNSKEIDVLVEDAATLSLLEIKRSANPDTREIKKFSLLEKSGRALGPGGIVCMCEAPFPIDSRNSFIPCNLI